VLVTGLYRVVSDSSQVVLSSVLVHGVSIPASKGLTRLWDGAEQRWFPEKWAQYQEHKDERDRELRAAEEGEAGTPQSEETQERVDSDHSECQARQRQ
jgi:hypothetical protein